DTKQEIASTWVSLQSVHWGPRNLEVLDRNLLIGSGVQNLIPLILFRPLRLAITSEQLRIARIVLLKATHMPHVAAIWIYEGVKRYWSNQQTGAPKRSMLASHISFSHKASKYSAIRNRSMGSLMARTPGNENRVHQARDPDTVVELKKVLDKLGTQEEMRMEKVSRQVEKLTDQAR
ncbi:MAG: hypothetical protein Q9183_002000, partial [Haloplaca sp. 2 TL-2023]